MTLVTVPISTCGMSREEWITAVTFALVVRGWIGSDDLWLRRLAILCQLDRKHETDLALLTDAIDAAADSPEFFLRKAIGWALRQHAKVDPGWVRDFVRGREQVLSGLSRREALKHVG